MRIGFTGTKQGMTDEQKALVHQMLYEKADRIISVHHGDCIGADADFHHIAAALNIFITIHPPENPKFRAFCKGAITHPEKGYLERNHDIVNDTSVLIATPAGKEVLRSGTWATIRYARKLKRCRYIIMPDGIILRI
jgi:hypothetical protein